MIVTVFCCVEHKKAVPGNNQHKRPDAHCLGTQLLLANIWARHVIYLAQIHLP